MKNWLESILVRNIQVFIGFGNFYQCFIQSFSKIAIPLISMLKITKLFKKLASKSFKAGNNKVVEGGNSRANKIVVNLSKNNKSRTLIYIPNIKAIKKPTFVTSNAKKIFNYLKQAFIKALIF